MRSKPGLAAAPPRTPRQGWSHAFAASPSADEKMFFEPLAPNAFDAEEWEWDEHLAQPENKNQKPETEN